MSETVESLRSVRAGTGQRDSVTASFGPVAIDERALRDHELVRARHALAYLKAKIGNDAMRALLALDVAKTSEQSRSWVAQSSGRWQSGEVELTVSGLTARAFKAWYEAAMTQKREPVLRAGHPEHFVLSPGTGGVEVIENIGETELPWRVFYRGVPDDAFPFPWDADYPVRFGAELVDAEGVRVAYTMHEAHDDEHGMRLRMRTVLPEAAPRDVVDRHLLHLAIEFTNWTRVALEESRNHGADA